MSSNALHFNSPESEFEIQAELYWRLKSDGVKIRGELKAWTRDQGRDCRCKLDLVVFDQLRRPIAIIECKNRDECGTATVIFRNQTRQSRRYNSFGIPVFQCLSMRHVPLVYDAVTDLLSKSVCA